MTGQPDTTRKRNGRRLGGGIRAAWVIVLTMLLAAAAWSLSGQLIRWGMHPALAVALSVMFDAAGLICATYARRAVERGTPAALARLSILLFVSVAGVLNWHHGHDIGGIPAAWGLASLSAGVELLFELHRRDIRDEQRAARGLIAERMPHVPLLGWVMYPVRSWHTVRAAVGVRLDLLDSVQAPQRTIKVERPSQPPTPSPRALEHAAQPPNTPAGPEGTIVDDVLALFGQAHAPIVYFIRNGNRVKIGTTQNVKRRLAALTLRPEDVIRAEHGAQRHERTLHRRFAEQRAGNTEWFDLTGTLAEYLGITPDASDDADPASGDAPLDAGDAKPDAEQPQQPDPSPTPRRRPLSPPPALPQTNNKTQLILAASSMLKPDASAAEIAHLLAQHGHAVDTAYIRTVLSRESKKAERGEGFYP